MKVFKFGGASINDIEKIKNVGKIIQTQKEDKLLVVVSAMGKTTNALEKVAEAFFNGNNALALELFSDIKNNHISTASSLQIDIEEQLIDIFTEVEWLLHDKAVREYDYYYDQIVCCGELLSTAIINGYLQSVAVNSVWVDVRDIFRTDNNFREANLDWNFTQEQVSKQIAPLFKIHSVIITQGFIGATYENESTTFGREGSDYTAALFANMLDAENQTIWKDVEGVMNADPKKYSEAQFIQKLSYLEVIEMAYYGAQVIHPKTIKPLQNKNIPLHVRCFLKPELAGTIISNEPVNNLPPIIVVKENQVLIELNSKDFSFVEDELIEQLHKLYNEVKIHPNITQNGAVSLLCAFDDRADKIDKLAMEASRHFDVHVARNLTLLTIRHYNDEIIQSLTKDKKIVLMQKTETIIQMVIK